MKSASPRPGSALRSWPPRPSHALIETRESIKAEATRHGRHVLTAISQDLFPLAAFKLTSYRQAELKCGAIGTATIEFNIPAMGAHDLARYREAKASAARLCRSCKGFK